MSFACLQLLILLFFIYMQFYKNLSTGLKDIVWKTGDEAKEELNDGL